MNLEDYHQLSKKEQEIAAMNGEFLAGRVNDEGTVALYRIGSLYVEVTYDSVRNMIVQLSKFEDLDRLVPYFQQSLIKPRF